jgi:hypothetical protein
MASIITATTTSGLTQSADNSGVLQLATNNGTTAVTINTAQKVGIGTTPSGSYILEVNGNPNFNSVGGVYLTCGTYDVIKNPSGNIIAFGGVTSSQWDTTALYTGGSERMRVDSSGNVSMGHTAYDYSVNGFGFGAGNAYSYFTRTSGFALGVNRKTTSGDLMAFWYNQSGVGNVSTNGSNCTFNSTSDYRLKQNIQPMTGALARVAKLKPVTYNWIRENQAGEGFIAHELQEVVPEAVTGTKDAVDEEGNPVYQAIDQSVLVATLTAAIQELKAELDATKAEVQALKGVA